MQRERGALKIRSVSGQILRSKWERSKTLEGRETLGAFVVPEASSRFSLFYHFQLKICNENRGVGCTL